VIYGFNAHEIFQIAIDIETNGEQFYKRAAAMLDNPEVKALLTSLGQEEIQHQKTFNELMSGLPKEAASNTV